jgi:cell division protein FtsL
MTGKLNIALLAVLIGSALVLVKTSYEARRLFTAVERAQGEGRRLDAEYKRIDAERQAQATSMRVERVARDRLKMQTATPGVTHYVVAPAQRVASGASP